MTQDVINPIIAAIAGGSALTIGAFFAVLRYFIKRSAVIRADEQEKMSKLHLQRLQEQIDEAKRSNEVANQERIIAAREREADIEARKLQTQIVSRLFDDVRRISEELDKTRDQLTSALAELTTVRELQVADHTKYEDDTHRMMDEIDNLRKQLEEARQSLTFAKKDIDRLNKQLGEVEEQRKRLIAENADLQRQLAETRKAKDILQGEIDALTKTVNTLRLDMEASKPKTGSLDEDTVSGMDHSYDSGQKAA